MLISFSHRFIFIHVYKVAGSSIRKALGKYEPLPVRLKRITGISLKKLGLLDPEKQLNYRNYDTHITAKELKKSLPKKVYDGFFKFAFVRNPWDWQVSLYHYMLRKTTHYQHEFIKSFESFDQYIEWRVTEDKHLQKEFVTDDYGNIIVDFIGKIESLEKDFDYVCKKIGIRSSLPHENRSQRRDYRSYYNERTKQLIYEHFREDIELFNYTFDE
ncbi:MAG: sulfotransferase family protein [Nitrospirae bacterium]|nr:sulfotransferase family protein [Nitrospirota bacterium]